MPREKEYDCLAHCPLERGALVANNDDDGGWTCATTSNDDAAAAAAALSCVYSPAETTLRLNPMFRKTPRTGPRWKPNVHFHADLNVTAGAAEPTWRLVPLQLATADFFSRQNRQREPGRPRNRRGRGCHSGGLNKIATTL